MDAILLAAGLSKRFGSNKLLHTIDNQPMYKHMLDLLNSLVGVSIDHLIVVTQYQEICDDMEVHYPKCDSAINPHPEDGISSSLRIGLSKLLIKHPDSTSCLFAVADQPYIQLTTVNNLCQSFQNDTSHGIAACCHEDMIGNPVIFASMYYDELLSLTGDVGGKRVVKKHLEDVLCIEVDEHELEDIDEDIQR